ncbi:FeoA family protein [Hydrogenovibrio kuenenii]|uniref:FeoA family protein n=1 Tax=Hydrogenovibrio kuenenii TaxID=63658 RepID=UPI000464B622|nr:FeoA family protein [Hydrogenovibrio kuenenii]
MPDNTVIRLDECHQHQTCSISALTGDLETKLHLVNLGFHTNSHIKVSLVRGDSFIVCVDGSRFAIDKKIAHFIKVHPLS